MTKKLRLEKTEKELKSETKKQRRKIVPDNKRKAITCGTVRAKRGKQTTWLKKMQSVDRCTVTGQNQVITRK